MIYLSVFMLVNQSVSHLVNMIYLPVCLCESVSPVVSIIYQPVCQSVSQTVSSIYLSVSESPIQSVCLSVHLSVYLSIHPFCPTNVFTLIMLFEHNYITTCSSSVITLPKCNYIII